MYHIHKYRGDLTGRLNYCRIMFNDAKNYWARELITNESRYSLNTHYRRVLIWREEVTRNWTFLVREISHSSIVSLAPLNMNDVNSLTLWGERHECVPQKGLIIILYSH